MSQIAEKQVAIVTGGGTGIGLATARKLAAAGRHVAICGRRAEPLREAQSIIESAGGSCEVHPLDLAEPGAGRRFVEAVVSQHERLELLVNAAGVAPLAKLEAMTDLQAEQTLAVNCLAVYATTQAAWPVFLRQGGGRVINVSSMAALDPFPGFAAYGASKAWVNLFTQAIADEGRPHGIEAFAVMFGAVDTPLLRSLFPDFPADQMLTADQAADAILNLLGSDHGHKSGAAIVVRK